MKRLLIRTKFKSVIIVIVLIITSGLSYAAPRDKVDDSIREKEKDLHKVKSQLQKEKARAKAIRKKEESLLSELEKIDKAIQEKKKELRILDGKLRKTQKDIAETEAALKELSSRKEFQRLVLANRLKEIYKIKTVGTFQFLASGSDLNDMGQRIKYLTSMAISDNRIIEEFTRNSERINSRKEELKKYREQLAEIKSRIQDEQSIMAKELDKKTTLLASVRNQKILHDRMINELLDASRNLENLLRDLQEKRKKEKAVTKYKPIAPSSPPPAVGFGAKRGLLSWPAEGRVANYFGKQIHSKFGTEIIKNGIEIEAQEGANIKAIYEGSVIFAGWFKGYGNIVILDHGNNFYTLYAHTSEIMVKEGDKVTEGQTIAKVGETGSLSGPRLYFEVRYQGKPEDPLTWLKRKL